MLAIYQHKKSSLSCKISIRSYKWARDRSNSLNKNHRIHYQHQVLYVPHRIAILIRSYDDKGMEVEERPMKTGGLPAFWRSKMSREPVFSFTEVFSRLDLKHSQEDQQPLWTAPGCAGCLARGCFCLLDRKPELGCGLSRSDRFWANRAAAHSDWHHQQHSASSQECPRDKHTDDYKVAQTPL